MTGRVDVDDFDEHQASPAELLRRWTLSYSQLEALPPLRWQIEGYVPLGGLGLLYGASNVGKTLVVAGMAMSVATGQPWCGRRVRQGKVVYCAGEGLHGLAQRLRAQAEWTGATGDPPISVLTRPVTLLSSEWSRGLAELVADQEADLLILDTWNTFTTGAEENSAKDVGMVLANVRTIQQARPGLSVLFGHHSGKDRSQGARGSSALRGAVDVELELEREGDARLLRVRKQRDAEPAPPIRFEFEKVAGSVVLAPSGHATTAPDADPWDATAAAIEAIESVLVDEWQSTHAVTLAVRAADKGVRKDKIEAGLACLHSAGRLERRKGPRNATQWRPPAPTLSGTTPDHSGPPGPSCSDLAPDQPAPELVPPGPTPRRGDQVQGPGPTQPGGTVNDHFPDQPNTLRNGSHGPLSRTPDPGGAE